MLQLCCSFIVVLALGKIRFLSLPDLKIDWILPSAQSISDSY